MNKEKLNDIVCESSSDYAVLNDAYNCIEDLEQQCKKQKEVIDKAIEWVEKNRYYFPAPDELLDILKEV